MEKANKSKAVPVQYRINFDTKAEFREYRLYCSRSSREFKREFKDSERVIIALTLMGWSQRKIIARSHPHITDWAIRATHRRLGCLAKIKAIIRQAQHQPRCDAMEFVRRTLDINGGVPRTGDEL